MKKTLLKKEASSTSSSKKIALEGEKYWRDRKADDSRMDWRNDGGNWIEEYVASVDHPHRDLIIEALKSFDSFAGLIEIGCNAGPNLLRVQMAYPETQLAGVDINKPAIERARELLPKALLYNAPAKKLPFDDMSFDICLVDAVLMYADDDSIHPIISEMTRVTRRGIILVEWYDQKEHVKDYHWARDYPSLLSMYGFDLIDTKPLTEENWPHKTWIKNGRLFVFQARSLTSKRS